MRQSLQFTGALMRRTHEFLVRADPAFALGVIKQHVDALGDVSAELARLVIEQDQRNRTGKAGTTSLRKQVRKARLEYMRPVARLAATLFPDDREFLDAITRPARSRKAEAVIAGLHGMANAVEPHKATFVAAGFADDFITRMRDVADALKTAVDGRAKDFARRSASSAGALRAAARGRAIIRLLDAMVSPRLESDPERLSEWRSLLRQGRVRVTPAEAESEVSPVATDKPAAPSGPLTTPNAA